MSQTNRSILTLFTVVAATLAAITASDARPSGKGVAGTSGKSVFGRTVGGDTKGEKVVINVLSETDLIDYRDKLPSDDGDKLERRLDELGFSRKTNRFLSAAATLGATIAIELAVDAVAAFLKAEAAKYEASYDGVIFKDDFENKQSKFAAVEILRFSEKFPIDNGTPASRLLFAFKHSGSDGVIHLHPVFLQVKSPKAKVAGKMEMTISVNLKLEVGVISDSGVKKSTPLDVTPLFRDYKVGSVATFNKGEHPMHTITYFTVPKSKAAKGTTVYKYMVKNGEVVLGPDGKPQIQYNLKGEPVKDPSSTPDRPRPTPYSLTAAITETDESKAAVILRKAAKVLADKKGDIVEVIINE